MPASKRAFLFVAHENRSRKTVLKEIRIAPAKSQTIAPTHSGNNSCCDIDLRATGD